MQFEAGSRKENAGVLAIIVVALNSPANVCRNSPWFRRCFKLIHLGVRKVVPFGGGWKLHVSWRNVFRRIVCDQIGRTCSCAWSSQVITHDGIAEQKIGELVAKLSQLVSFRFCLKQNIRAGRRVGGHVVFWTHVSRVILKARTFKEQLLP